ncbi:MAG: hypothetical protein J6A21_09555 [Lentisphaeria bacterium]|nr:hypothetical protein [Lentisphaeria bacterium]
MAFNTSGSNGTLAGLSLPGSPEEMIRNFPALLSALRIMEAKISSLEQKINSLEKIGGNGNQL